MKLIDGFDSNYRYILVAARRARQLQSGAPPVVQTNSRKPCRIAQDEIRAGKVKWEIPELAAPSGRPPMFWTKPSARLNGLVGESRVDRTRIRHMFGHGVTAPE